MIGISSWKDFREVEFDLVIVDEAGRATLNELFVSCIKAKRIILVGDHKQLAPVVDDDVIEKLGEKRVRAVLVFRQIKKMQQPQCLSDFLNAWNLVKNNTNIYVILKTLLHITTE